LLSICYRRYLVCFAFAFVMRLLLLLMLLFTSDEIGSKICCLVPLYCFCDLATELCSPEVNQKNIQNSNFLKINTLGSNGLTQIHFFSVQV